MKKIYVVTKRTIDFDYTAYENVRAYLDEEKAEKFAEECNKDMKELIRKWDELSKEQRKEENEIRKKYDTFNRKDIMEMVNSQEWKDLVAKQRKEKEDLLETFPHEKLEGYFSSDDEIEYTFEIIDLYE